MINNPNAEKIVLYACINNRDDFYALSEITREDAFFNETNKEIFRAVTALHDAQEPCDLVTVTTKLKREGKELFDAVVDIVDSPELGMESASASARIMEELYVRRSIHDGLKEAMLGATDLSQDVFDLQEMAERAVFGIRKHANVGSVKDMGVSVAEVLAQLQKAQEVAREGRVVGVSSGYKDIDRIMLGWQPSDLIILAARPSVGKSALGMSYAFNAGVPALVISLEMSARQLTERQIMPDTGVQAYVAKSGRLTDKDWQAINRVADSVSKMPVFIDDRPGMGIAEFKSTARRMKMKHDIGIIVIDYIQLMVGSNLSKNANREQEIAQISRGLKHTAKELDIPIIALSQLNRAVRHDERPTLANLRESGAIEQDADVVQFIWRDPDINGERSPVVNYAFDKNRNGALSGGQLVYKPDSTRLVPYYEDEVKLRYNGE